MQQQSILSLFLPQGLLGTTPHRCGKRLWTEEVIVELQVHAAHGGEELKVIFPSDDEMAVSKAMEQMLVSRGPAK